MNYINNKRIKNIEMKRLKFIIVMFCVVLNCNAQFRVNSNGNASFGCLETPLSMVSVNCPGNANWQMALLSSQYGLYSKREGANSSWGCAVFGSSANASTNFSTGVRGDAYSYTVLGSGRSYGVFGVAGNSTSGWNYGVFGRLDGSNNGAAIYGTTSSLENGTDTGGKYAGYFRGATKVVGNLTVTGAVSGTILSNAISTSEKVVANAKTYVVDDMESSESMLAKMDGFVAIPYFINNTKPNAMKVKSLADTLEVEPSLSKMEMQNISKKHYALSIDKLREAFPDLVYENEDGTAGVNYVEMVPILVQTINELSSRLQKLESGLVYSKTRSTNNIEDKISNEVILKNNIPNPFSTSTSITYNIPSDVKEAILYIYDMTGKQLKKLVINERGQGSISISADDFSDGMYIYALVIDGNVYSSKRMIVGK